MTTIYKYQVRAFGTAYHLPINAKFLSVQAQSNEPFMWFEIDSETQLEERHFRAYGTGHEITQLKRAYLGTFLLNNGSLVFHLYELL